MKASLKTAQQILDEHALGENTLSHSVLACLRHIAAGDTTSVLRIGRTSRMTGDFVDAVQDDDITIYNWQCARLIITGYYVCTDAGFHGGPVILAPGGAHVAAEFVDGVHRLDAHTGELIDPDFVL